MIHREHGKWVVRSEDGRPLGSYTSRAAAEKRLAQVEYWKHKDAQREVHRRARQR